MKAKYKNPIILKSNIHNTDDPFVVVNNGKYYHVYMGNDGVVISEAESLDKISEAIPNIIYDTKKDGAFDTWWAPELHFIDGAWYVYGSPKNEKGIHCMRVLKSDSITGEYKEIGTIEGIGDNYSLDGTFFRYDGKPYFLWSAGKEIYISEMESPTKLCGKKAKLIYQKYDFERLASDVIEGPAVLIKDGVLSIVYSTNDSMTDEYCLGLMVFKGGDVLDENCWEHVDHAVFKKTRKIFGPGHCSFFTVAEKGKEETYIVYHANLVSGSGWNGRNVFIQKIKFKKGIPVLGKPRF